jgi:hypothetical protein
MTHHSTIALLWNPNMSQYYTNEIYTPLSFGIGHANKCCIQPDSPALSMNPIMYVSPGNVNT